MKKLLALLIFGFCLSSLQAQTEYFVSTSGDNANSCATAQTGGANAKRWIINDTGGDSGSTCLSAGDTLTIEVGTYDESLARGDWVDGGGTWGTATIYQAKAGDTVTLQPTNIAANQKTRAGHLEVGIEVDGNWIIWDGIDINCVNMTTNGACATIRSISSVQAHHIRITNSDIGNGIGNGISQSADAPKPDNIEIIGNTIHDNGAVFDSEGNTCQFHGVYASVAFVLIEENTIHSQTGGSGIQTWVSDSSVHDNIIRRNIIHGNDCQGIQGGRGERQQIYNNIVYKNGVGDFGSGRGIAAGGTPPDLKIWNNTIFDNEGNCIMVDANAQTGLVIQNNICWGNDGGDTILDVDSTGSVVSNNLLGSDPLFVSETPGSEDFDFTSGSPARNQGADLAGEFDVDADRIGTLRPQGSQWDIGSFEFPESTPPPPGCGGNDIVATQLIALTTDSVDRSSYTTPSVSPSDDALQVFIISNEDSDTTPPDIPVISGFTTVETIVRSTSRRTSMLRRLESSATSGTLDITFATDPQDWIHYQMYELSSVDIGGTNGADAVVQSDSTVDGGTESCLITLNAFGSTNNATVGSVLTTSTRTFTEGTGFTMLSQGGSDGHSTGVQWRNDNDTTVDFTWTTSAGEACIAAEIKRAAACVGQPTSMRIGMMEGMLEGVNP